jgi:hypothetical protein
VRCYGNFVYLCGEKTKNAFMIDLLRDILKSDAGSFSFIFALICLVIYGVHKVTKFTTNIGADHGVLAKRVDRIETNIDEIRKDLAVVKGNIEATIAIRDTLTKKKSPISLTDAGINIMNEYDLKNILTKNWDKILRTTNDIEIKNPYDLQEYFIETAYLEPLKFFSKDDVDILKTVSYKTGFAFMSIARVMGILIRDAYFTHKGIAVEDVDKTDPNKT